jgi:hypothetical protein
MRKLLLFVLLVVSNSLFSQIPDSLEVTLPWDIIYVNDCHSDVGAAPTTTNDGVYISEPEIILIVEDDNGNCDKKLLEYTILDWVGNATYSFIQILKVDEIFTLHGVSGVTITYDELPFAITASDLIVDADPTHTYSFDPNDETATIINYGQSYLSSGIYNVFVYDHNDKAVTEVNIIITDCEEDVVFDIPSVKTIEFNGEYFIPFSEDLLDINIVYPCSDYSLTIKRGSLNGVFAHNIGETIEVKVVAKTEGATPSIIFTEYIMVVISGEGPIPIPMYIEEKTFTAGEEFTLDIWSDQVDNLIAWQFRLNFENAKIIELTSGSPFGGIPHNIFNDDKIINTLWTPDDVHAIDIASNETWFTLTILPSIDGSTLDIFTTENDPWSSIFIEEAGSVIDVEVDFSFQIEERNFLVSNVDVEENSLRIHNNPVTDRLVVSGFNHYSDGSQFSIFSLDGKQVMSTSLDRSASKVELDVTNLQTGVYILNMEGVKSKPIKFIKI